eukprot:GCRY01001090.1.p1 GENE.GCRY01001090.1~~GCRY01001090.1.p1  ORF type:complete len:215 (-),score=25.89 GCRY01001090.1:97-741(-)
MKVFLLFTFFLLFAHYSNAMFFYMVENERKCFLEEVPENTLVVSQFKILLADTHAQLPSKDMGVRMTVKDPAGHVLVDQIKSFENRVAFSSHFSGDYEICIQPSKSETWFGNPRRLKVDFSLDVGENAVDYEAMATAEHLTGLEVRLRRLNNQIMGIRSMQDFAKNREMVFRDTSESTCSRATWFALLQISIVLISAFWQLQYLKTFFKSKKLI